MTLARRSAMTLARRYQPDLSAAAGWALAMSLVGYPVAGLIGSALNWDSTLASIPFRLGVLALSVVLWIKSPPIRKWARASPWLMAFTLFYLSRLLWDFLVAGVPGAGDALTFYVLTVLVPSAALGLVAGQLREDQAAQAIALTGGVVCAMAVTMYFMEWGMDRSLTEQTRRLSFEAVNPITLGHVAVTTIIAALAILQRGRRRWQGGTAAVLIGVALTCLVLAASRAPLLVLGVCGFTYAVSTGSWRIRLMLLGAAVLVGTLIILGGGGESEIFVRISDIEEDDSSLQRLLLQANAITQFLGSPILGSAFTELAFLEYPHNLFIETGMALGMVGLVVMVTLTYLAGVQAVRRLRAGEVLMPLLLFQYFLAIQFSGSIWGSAGFWALMAVMLGLKSAPAVQRLARGRRTQLPATAEPGLVNTSTNPTS